MGAVVQGPLLGLRYEDWGGLRGSWCGEDRVGGTAVWEPQTLDQGVGGLAGWVAPNLKSKSASERGENHLFESNRWKTWVRHTEECQSANRLAST